MFCHWVRITSVLRFIKHIFIRIAKLYKKLTLFLFKKLILFIFSYESTFAQCTSLILLNCFSKQSCCCCFFFFVFCCVFFFFFFFFFVVVVLLFFFFDFQNLNFA